MAQEPDDDVLVVESVEVSRGLAGVGGGLVFAGRCAAGRPGLVCVDPLAVGGEQGEGGDRPRRGEVEVGLRVTGVVGDWVGVGVQDPDGQVREAFPVAVVQCLDQGLAVVVRGGLFTGISAGISIVKRKERGER